MSDKNLSFLGAGLLGNPMALRLRESGFSLHVWNRNAEKTRNLKQEGAAIAATPYEAIAASDITILMLSDAAAIRATILTPEATPALQGKTILQMGTISPKESQAIAKSVEQAGGTYAECPVLGSIPEATAGKLILMFGGTKALFERLNPILTALGPKPNLVGPIGQAAALKLAMNQLIASLTIAFSQSLGLVQQQGIDVSLFMEILRGSALYAPTFDKKLQRMLNRDFSNPNFPVKHLLKDMNLFLQCAGQAGLSCAAAEGVKSACEKTILMGAGEEDYSAIFKSVAPVRETR